MKNTMNPANRILLLIPFLCYCFAAYAQQLPTYSIYRDQWNVINPAAISNNYLINERHTSVGATYRRQWWNTQGGPSTQIVNFEHISHESPSVIGAHVINDQTGQIGQTGFYANYAYRISLGRRTEQTISIGLAAGLVQYRASLNKIDFPDPSSRVSVGDKLLFPDFSLGIFYHYADRFYAGLSIPQVFDLNTQFEAGKYQFGVRRVPHLYAVIGKYFDTWLGNETSFIEPSLWIKYVPGAPLSVDFTTRMQVSELLWGGIGIGTGLGKVTNATMRLEAGIVLGEQVRLEDSQIKIGFAYDWALAPTVSRSLGSTLECHLIYSW